VRRDSWLCPETLPQTLFASISLDKSAVVRNQLHYIMYENSKCEKLEPHFGMSHGFQSQLNQSTLHLLASPRQLYRDPSLVHSSATCSRDDNNDNHLTRCLCRQIRRSALAGTQPTTLALRLKHVHREIGYSCLRSMIIYDARHFEKSKLVSLGTTAGHDGCVSQALLGWHWWLCYRILQYYTSNSLSTPREVHHPNIDTTTAFSLSYSTARTASGLDNQHVRVPDPRASAVVR
jgi:hypothetical protein